MSTSNLEVAIDAAYEGQRLTPAQALALLEQAPLHLLGTLATRARTRRNPAPVVTYAVDRNINYTNICISRCKFCAFWRPEGHEQAYVLTLEELLSKAREARERGATHVLIQGGLNPALGLEQICQMLSALKHEAGVHVHGLSPPEVVFLARQEKMSIAEVLQRLVEAGLGSIPGGGAEILVDEVRSRIAPRKCTGAQWLEVMDQAHKMGLMTTATMMFGHIETPAHRIQHLELLRELQDKSITRGKGRFTAFIPWTFQPRNTALAHLPEAGSVEYLRMLAVSRLYLDNFEHIQASWVTQGAEVAQMALAFGADDLGSTIMEENVVAAAGARFRMGRQEMVRLGRQMGYQLRQRDALYRFVD